MHMQIYTYVHLYIHNLCKQYINGYIYICICTTITLVPQNHPERYRGTKGWLCMDMQSKICGNPFVTNRVATRDLDATALPKGAVRRCGPF